MSIVSELKRRKVIRVALGYIVFAWALIQVVETIFPAFGLDEAAFRMLVVTLAIGLVPAVILSWAFNLTRSGIVRDSRSDQSTSPDSESSEATVSLMAVLRSPRFGIPLALTALMLVGTISLMAKQLSDVRKARVELLPKIEALVADNDIDGAFALAREAEDILPDDPLLTRLWADVAVRMSFITEPAGATVSYRVYSDLDRDWRTLGTSPLEGVRLPRAVLRWRFEKPGFETAERAGDAFDGRYRVELVEGELGDDEVRIPNLRRSFLLTGYAQSRVNIPTFRSNRFEVTNTEYLAFVRGGGYEDEEHWSHLTFVLDGTELPWEQAVDRFRDRTGRVGPSTWEGGTHAEGKGQWPVTGISWFEAAAYAHYRGKQLPTIYHWSSMTIFPSGQEIETESDSRPAYGLFRSELTALSNFSESGPAEVGTHRGVSPYGIHDAAGNVREWCWNATDVAPGTERYILGGASEDPAYLYTYGVAKSPWDRSPANGVRLVSYDTATVSALREPVALPASEILTPISDEVFEVYRDRFDYDRTPLNIHPETAEEESEYWTRETVSFDAVYGDERVLVHVFLPQNIEPPYQVVLYFPSSAAIYRQSSEELEFSFIDYIIQSGRAVVYPVLKDTYERHTALDTTWPQATHEYSNRVVQWIQDVRRTVDYLETRSDIDLGKLGYFGFSWGGWNGPIVLALDDRFDTGVFLSGGIPPTLARPEATSASYASRVSQPVLMISGRNDVLRPVETFQAPMFESLGTPDALKRHAILEGGHLPPRGQIIVETLAWLDQFLGPVAE